jgi:hypothetical protein
MWDTHLVVFQSDFVSVQVITNGAEMTLDILIAISEMTE